MTNDATCPSLEKSINQQKTEKSAYVIQNYQVKSVTQLLQFLHHRKTIPQKPKQSYPEVSSNSSSKSSKKFVNKVIAICPKIFSPYCMFYCKIFACGHFLRQSLQLYRKKRLLIHRLATKRVSKYFSKIKLLQFKIMILSQKHFSFNSICKKWVIKAA